MSMWPRDKPLSQPPHFRTGQHATPPVDQVAKQALQALQALRHARNERSNSLSRKVAA